MPALSLRQLADDLRSGALPLLDYLEELERLLMRLEPQVQALVPEPERFTRLRTEAAALLAMYPQPEQRPALFGVPVGIKDIFHVDGFVTRAGARLDSRLLQGAQAAAVTAVRQAGALILGKTVTTEFAYFAPGPTRNPHNPAHTPGGSSSGSAAAVAAGFTPLALGTQTIGSINRPAAYCGVVGFKPSFERISTAGVIPVSPSADHAGFFVPQAADAAYAAALLCRDWQEASPARPPVLGIPRGPYLKEASAEGQAHFAAVCRHLHEAGYTVKEVPLLPDFAAIAGRHQDLVAAEAAVVHRDWYPAYAERYHPKTAALLERGAGVSDERRREARAGRAILRHAVEQVMAAEGIDLWLSPPAPGAALRGLESTGDPILNLPWTHAGLPALTLPAGKNGAGLPLGLQVIARWYGDEQLLAWAVPLADALPQVVFTS